MIQEPWSTLLRDLLRRTRPGALTDPIEHDAKEDNTCPGNKPHPEVGALGESGNDVVAERAGADETADDDIARTRTMPWFTARSNDFRESGSWTFQSNCRSVEPAAVAASTTVVETPRMPASTSRMTGGAA